MPDLRRPGPFPVPDPRFKTGRFVLHCVKFWDSICEFHEACVRDNPTDDRGLRAVRFIRSMLEEHWSSEPVARHPLIQRLSWASSQNNAWLDLHARKLGAAARVPGFSLVCPRLGHPAEYLAAMAEVEVALKLSVSGHEVSFVARARDPTPDLVAILESSSFNVEVSYLNPPDEERRIQQLFSEIITVGMMLKVSTGGPISRAPSAKELTEFMARVRAAAEQSKSEQRVVRVNKPGLATVYLAPHHLVNEMPEDSRHSFRIVPPTRWPIERQIGRKIEEKAAALSSNGRSGLLVIYSGMVGLAEATKLFEEPADDVFAVLASYPRIAGLVLAVPMRYTPEAGDEPTRSNEHRTLVTRRSSTDEREVSVVWRNPHADKPLPDSVVAALEAYPDRMLALPSVVLSTG